MPDMCVVVEGCSPEEFKALSFRDAVMVLMNRSTLVDMSPKLPRCKVTGSQLDHHANKVIRLVLSKNADYKDAWQKQGIFGVLVRLSDKLCRIENLSSDEEALVAQEGLRDTLMDAVGYSLLGLVYLDYLDNLEVSDDGNKAEQTF